MLCHIDDVPWSTFEHGDLRAERQRLGAAAGSRDVGLSRYRIAPGCRAMPLHAHVDEEEIFFVLAGSGHSWQDDARHEIAAGDVIVYRADGCAHTLVAAAAEALDVLAFASGSRSGLTRLPRAGVTWVGRHWLPADAPHPFSAEPAAGELPPIAPRPSTIVALEDVPAEPLQRGRIGRARRNLGRAAGSSRSGIQHVTIEPDRYSSPRHCHSAEEELFVVLEGDGAVWLGDERHPVHAGSVVARPPGTGVAHAFEAAAEGLTLLAYGTREPSDLCWYPDSSKILFGGLRVAVRVEAVDTWDGEP